MDRADCGGSEATSPRARAKRSGYRGLRDAAAEATFFQVYANLFAFYLDNEKGIETATRPVDEPRDLPFVKEVLASVDKGGYPEALGRVAFLMAHEDKPLPLSRLQLAHDLIEEYREFLPQLAPDELRRIGGEQEIIARYEPEKAVETLPVLVADRKDRNRLLTLLERVLADPRVQGIRPSAEQKAMRRARRRGAPAARVTAPFSADPRQCSGDD